MAASANQHLVDRTPESGITSDSSLIKRETIFLTTLFVAAVLVRLWGVSKIHSWDEMVYLQNAKVICCGKNNYSELVFHPPLISLLFAGTFLISHSMFVPCILAAALNALAPVFLYLAGRESRDVAGFFRAPRGRLFVSDRR